MSTNQTQHYGLHLWEPGDDFLRTEFNENFGAIDGALGGKCEILAGSYTGNGVSGRIISLGCTPKAVLVKDPKNESSYLHTNEVAHAPAFAVQGVTGNILNVTDGGFTVTNHGLVNNSGQTYLYIAFC